jgi:hypothetical protein
MFSDTYFIRGLQHWSKCTPIDLFHPEISVSLQKDGFTKPLREFGFIIEINHNGIIASFDRDVTSKIKDGKRVFSPWSNKKWRDYGEDMISLIGNTREGSHNEIWVDTDYAQIIGGYVIGNNHKGFQKSLSREGYPIHCLHDINMAKD